MKHSKLKISNYKDKGFTTQEKAELVFLIMFFLFLAAAICAFICAGLALVMEMAK